MQALSRIESVRAPGSASPCRWRPANSHATMTLLVMVRHPMGAWQRCVSCAAPRIPLGNRPSLATYPVRGVAHPPILHGSFRVLGISDSALSQSC